jgi:hypothetical protein
VLTDKLIFDLFVSLYICEVKTTQNDCCRLHYYALLSAVQGGRDRTQFVQVILRVLLLLYFKVNDKSLKVMHACMLVQVQ